MIPRFAAFLLALAFLALTPGHVYAEFGDGGRPATKATTAYRVRAFNVVNLPWRELPYNGSLLEPLRPTYPQDRNGVIMWRNPADGRLYYHPVNMVQRGVTILDSYVRTGISAYLTRARAIAAKLRDVGTVVGGGLYLPYPFAWTHDSYRASPPWYSGMAQGIALSFFTRLYRLTKQTTYLATARQLFRSMTRLVRTDPWVAYVDSNRYLWIEEFPKPTPNHILNGFVFAIYGVYDYFWQTREGTALTYLRGSLTTIRDNITHYRVPGGVSYYCYCTIRSAHYHAIHTRQLWKLARMTGDSYFQQQGDLFYQDYH